jgi:peptidoglycan hydrolase-like protein with peptidoglycan-binding domain
METSVYSRITSYMDTMNYVNDKTHLGKATKFDNPVLQTALKAFNAFPASEEGGRLDTKVKILNQALRDLGYGPLTEGFSILKDGTAANAGYNQKEAAKNRQRNLGALDPADYPAALLPIGYLP